METNKVNELLNNIYLHTNIQIENKAINGINENLEILGDILGLISIESENPMKSRFFKIWEQYTDKLFDKMVKNNMQVEALKYMRQFYQINKDNGFKVQLYFDETLNSLLNYVRDERNLTKLQEMDILDLFDDMLENTGVFKGVLQDNNIPNLFSRYYFCLYKNLLLDKDSKRILIKRFSNHCLNLPIYNFVISDDNKRKVVQSVIERVFKSAIDLKDSESFQIFLNVFSKNGYFLKDKLNVNIIYLKISIYLFYLIGKEELIEDEDKEFYNKILQNNRSLFKNELSSICDLWKDYSEVQKSLHTWEHFGEDAKILLMNGVVREFFYYLTIATGNFRVDNVSEEVLDENEVFIFINTFINGNLISCNIVKSYELFKQIFGFSEGDSKNELTNLQNELMTRYKKIIFERVRSANENFEILNLNKNGMVEKLNQIITSNAFFKTTKDNIDNVVVQNNKIQFVSITVPIEFIADKVEQDFSFIGSIFDRALNEYIRASLLNKGFLQKTVKFSAVNKIETLKELISSAEELNENSINSLIYGIKENSSFMYTEKEEAKEYYRNLLREIRNKEYIEKPEWIGFNKDSLRINRGQLEVVIREPLYVEIMNTLVKKDDGYFINITNDINLKFEMDEAIEYLRISKRIIEVYFDMSIELINSDLGFVLEINS
ncbi:hypothetical protein [Psychrobacillus sp. FSL H8-0487]|uniref:hypothetical protein n=1 Tax=Psychrobacillus sp. FSL H8-0487 TaxID=2921391 RepID=UPI0030F4BD0A